jgi:hypothetical protein
MTLNDDLPSDDANAPLNLRNMVRAAMADTQFEVGRAQTRWQRWKALARGYAAVVRLVLVSPFFIGGDMNRWLATLLLGAVGSGLLLLSFSQTNGPLAASPFLLLAIVTAVVLRVFKLGNSYWQMFQVCVAVGVIMGATSYFGISFNPRISVLGHLWRLAVLLGGVLFVSAVAASVAWAGFDRRTVFGQMTTAVLVGWTTFAIVAWAMGPLSWALGFFFPTSDYWLVWGIAYALVYSFFFAVLSSMLIAPLLFLLRRVVSGRIPLTVVGALLFPLPLFALNFLTGGGRGVSLIREELTTFRLQHVTLLSWVFAAGAIGWCLATLRPNHPAQDATTG